MVTDSTASRTILAGWCWVAEERSLNIRLQNDEESLSEAMTGIVSFEFEQIGDYQSHQRGGAFRNKLISYDMDKGIYAEFEQEEKEEDLTEDGTRDRETLTLLL